MTIGARTLLRGVAVLGLASIPGCGPPSREPAPAPRPAFTEVTSAAGIVHTHVKPALDPSLENIEPWMSSVGAAACATDVDRDGWIDLYVTNSRKGEPNFLYRNDRDGTFRDIAAVAGVASVNGAHGVSMDCIWSDFDNDGLQDLYLVRWGNDALFRNAGDGTFVDVTNDLFRDADGRPGMPWANGNAVIALDYDHDGRLDFYVGNYFRDVDLWRLESTKIMHDSFENARNAGRNFLFHQEPDGTFTEVAGKLGVDDTGWTLAVGSADLNNDGWPDLYAANDFGPDRIYLNEGDGTFVNSSERSIGYDTRKGMNVDIGDFNNDGWFDIYVSNITTAEYLQEGNMLWRNNGPGEDGVVRFMDISPESSTYDGGWGWGAKFLDYDNDGDLDLFAVNGFISAGEGSYWYDLASWTVLGKDPADSRNWPEIGDRSFSGHEAFRFWRNDGFETFSETASEIGLDSDRDGRGIVCVDYDNDGDLDLFVANQGQAPQLFNNSAPDDRRWLTVVLKPDPSTGVNADGIGTRVTVVTDLGTQIREREGGNGFAGQSDPRLHFGLGSAGAVRLLEVRWPDGGLQYLEDVATDRFLTVTQDPEAYVAAALVAVSSPVPRASTPTSQLPDVPEMDPDELERLLATYEAHLLENPSDHKIAYAYRRRCADHRLWNRSIRFFESLVDRRPDDLWARMELSVAYVDKIPSCGGLAAIVCKGTLARKSLDQLDPLIASHPTLWAPYYARGMNHLHWPRALRHLDDAIADFETCLELQRADESETRARSERTYILLGDAQARNGDADAARRSWRRGLAPFPDSRALAERLALAPGEEQAWVDARRSLEQPIDTDFTFLERH